MTTFAAVLLVGALGLAGCSRDAQRYDDVAALARAVSAAGVDCDPMEPGREARLVGDSGICARSGVRLYLFDSARDLEDWRKVGARLGPTVVGPNWVATGNVRDIARISDELGGELVDANE